MSRRRTLNLDTVRRALQMASDALERDEADRDDRAEVLTQLDAEIEAHTAVNEALAMIQELDGPNQHVVPKPAGGRAWLVAMVDRRRFEVRDGSGGEILGRVEPMSAGGWSQGVVVHGAASTCVKEAKSRGGCLMAVLEALAGV